MNTITKEIVDDLADKLLIGLSSEENKMVLDEFTTIQENLDLVTKIPGIENIEPMTHCLDDFEYVLRNDDISPSVNITDLLENSDETEGREIVVPKVVG